MYIHILMKNVSTHVLEVTKLQTHLQLLREEYVKLQTRCAELEKQHQVALASAGQVSEDNFVSRLLRTVAELFDTDLYRLVLLSISCSNVNFIALLDKGNSPAKSVILSLRAASNPTKGLSF